MTMLQILLAIVLLSSSYLVIESYSPRTFGGRRANLLKSPLKMSSEEKSDAVPTATSSTPVGLKALLMTDMKDAMKAKDKVKLSGVRAIQAAIKQKEIDDRIVVDDEQAIIIMSKLIKQIRESIKSYGDAGRQDLVDKEQAELDVVSTYMPVQLSAEEVDKMIDDCIVRLGATTIKDMGKVMAELKPVLMGKTDNAAVGASIKKKLGGSK